LTVTAMIAPADFAPSEIAFSAGPMAVRLGLEAELDGAASALVDGFAEDPNARPAYAVEVTVGSRRERPRGLPREPRFVRQGNGATDRSELWDAAVTWSDAAMHADFRLRSTRHLPPELRALWQARLHRLWLSGVVRAALALAAPRAGALLLHASALVAPSGQAFVFAGPSGEGKTSMRARLPGWRLLADDAVLVFAEAGAWRAAGTPLSGRERLPRDGAAAPLGGLMLLEKGAPELTLVPLAAAQAFARLMPRILYYAEPDEHVLAVAQRLATTAPCQRLASSLEHALAPALLARGGAPC
jgi:hypothetical protein